MSAQNRSHKYDTGGAISTMDVPMSDHALERYRERLPADAVEPAVAWRRGEDIQHPAVVQTLHQEAPARVRVYNHDQRYYAIFIVDNKTGREAVVTVYNGQTHDHGPTRSYLNSHGPHYTESGGDD